MKKLWQGVRMPKAACILGLAAMLSAGGGISAQADDQRAMKARLADSALAWSAENGRLRPYMQAFPKGGDIHTHLRGAVYAESWLKWAAEDGLCADMSVPGLRHKVKESCAASGWVTAAEAQANSDHRRQLIDALSNRSYVPTLDWSGHNDFFATFARISNSPRRWGDQFAEIASRAGHQNILYLEPMITLIFPELFPLLGDVKLSGDLAADYQMLMSGDFGAAMPTLLASARSQLKAGMARKDEILKCGTPEADAGCGVTIRFLHQVIREMEPAMVYGQFILGWALMEQEPLMVGTNLVAPEDRHVSLRDYTLHMRMIDHLYRNEGPRNVALHAGELAIGLVPPEFLTFHIREAIDLGHAKRIGHGVAIMYEDGAEELLTRMARDKIMVEINLTSNDTILGIKGRKHPVGVYRDVEVPFALSTDDEGVSRIDLTHEYMRFYEEHRAPYFELRYSSRNALTYSFLDGASLWENAACKKDVEQGTDAGAECAAFLKTSEKARLQWELEERFRVFEDEQRIPERKRTSFH
ncbi:MAG: adenosine deaminase [Alphaproteobacteria bacterium]|nr:adenosine deaminase [Alphaproteobacteria bacterium]